MISICILTTAHPPFNHRVFHKEARTLKAAGYDVTVIAPVKNAQTVDGIRVLPTGASRAVPERWVALPYVARLAAKRDADVYHFHDPELLPVGLLLASTTSGTVIADVHEYFSKEIHDREWIPEAIAPLMSTIGPPVYRTLSKRLDAIVAATDGIADRYQTEEGPQVVTVQNFPRTSTLTSKEPVDHDHGYLLVYVGYLSPSRGLEQMIDVTGRLRDRGMDVGLRLVGDFENESARERCMTGIKKFDLDDRVSIEGYVEYSQIMDYLVTADLGLALLDPERYDLNVPTKIFEYMYAGLPVVATPTSLIREYLSNDCGVLVPYGVPSVQADIIEGLLTDSERRHKMANIGRDQVENKYNWEVEQSTLLNLYESLNSCNHKDDSTKSR